MAKNANSGSGESVRTIEAFEERHDLRLPLSYRNYMLEHGGGSAKPDCFIDTARNTPFYVARIFGLSDSRMAEQLFPFLSPKQTDFLPVATDAGGNYYLLHLQNGEVYFWDHESKNRRLLARDFETFVSSLTYPAGETPQALDEIEEFGRAGAASELDDYLERHGLLERSGLGLTLTEEAARYGNLDVIRACVDRGAQTSGLLHFAAQGRSLDVISYLVETGVDPNELDESGQSPLDRAVDQKTYELLQSLGGVHVARSRPPHLR